MEKFLFSFCCIFLRKPGRTVKIFKMIDPSQTLDICPLKKGVADKSLEDSVTRAKSGPVLLRLSSSGPRATSSNA